MNALLYNYLPYLRSAAPLLCLRPGPLRSESHKFQNDGTITWYSETVNYLLAKYAIDDIIVLMDASIMHFIQMLE